MEERTDCRRCGTCCIAPDIATLKKAAGVRCLHLTPALSCADYDNRPAVCRNYRPDEICTLVAASTVDERVAKYLSLFDLPQQPVQPE